MRDSDLEVGIMVIPDPDFIWKKERRNVPAKVVSVRDGFGGRWAKIQFPDGEFGEFVAYDLKEAEHV